MKIIANTLYNIVHENTGQELTYNLTTKVKGGSDINDNDIDGFIYRKYQNQYFKLNFDKLTPEHFNAKADGTTNDTFNINNAIALMSKAGGGELKFRDDAIYLTDSIIPKSDIHLNFGKAIIKKASNFGSRFTNHMIRTDDQQINGTYYGRHKNIKITGGYFDGNGFSNGNNPNMFSLRFLENFKMEDVTILNYFSGGEIGNGCFAFGIGGKNIRISNVNVNGGQFLFQDGIHILHGSDIKVNNCSVNAGDDALALGVDSGDIFDIENDGIYDVKITNCTLNSVRANSLTLYCPSETTSLNYFIKKVLFSNITGKSGQIRNGGINIVDKGNLNRISDVKGKDINLEVGSSQHDGTNAFALRVQSANDVKINTIKLKVTDSTIQTISPFQLANFINSTKIKINNLSCDELPKKGIYIENSEVKFNELDISQTNQAIINPIFCTKSNVKLSKSKIDNVQNFDIIKFSGNAGDNSEISLDDVELNHATNCVGYAVTGISEVIFSKMKITNCDFSKVGGMPNEFGVNQAINKTQTKLIPIYFIRNNLGISWESTFGNTLDRDSAMIIDGGNLGTSILTLLRSGISSAFSFLISGGLGIRQQTSPPSFSLLIKSTVNGLINRVVVGMDTFNTTARDGNISAEDVASGTNVKGANLIISTGRGRGNAEAPDIYFETPDKTSSGSTLQNTSYKAALKGDGTFILGDVTQNNSSSIISVNSTTKGALNLPRMTKAQRLAITLPAIGLKVYQLTGIGIETEEGEYQYKSSGWVKVS